MTPPSSSDTSDTSDSSDTSGGGGDAGADRSTAMRDADLANGEGDPSGGADGASTATSHPTGAAQAAQNRDEDPPA